jgi:hypothetical protein
MNFQQLADAIDPSISLIVEDLFCEPDSDGNEQIYYDVTMNLADGSYIHFALYPHLNKLNFLGMEASSSGLLTHMCEVMPPWARANNIAKFVISGPQDATRVAFETIGFAGNPLSLDVSQDPCLAEQYFQNK